MTRSVVYSPRAKQQLTDLYIWIAEQSGFPHRAEGYVSAIFDYCDGLADFPFIGVPRDDLRKLLHLDADADDCAVGVLHDLESLVGIVVASQPATVTAAVTPCRIRV